MPNLTTEQLKQLQALGLDPKRTTNTAGAFPAAPPMTDWGSLLAPPQQATTTSAPAAAPATAQPPNDPWQMLSGLLQPQAAPDFSSIIRAMHQPSELEAAHQKWVGAQLPSYAGNPNNPFNNGFFNSSAAAKPAPSPWDTTARMVPNKKKPAQA